MIPSVMSCLCRSICDPTDVVVVERRVSSLVYHQGHAQKSLRPMLGFDVEAVLFVPATDKTHCWRSGAGTR